MSNATKDDERAAFARLLDNYGCERAEDAIYESGTTERRAKISEARVLAAFDAARASAPRTTDEAVGEVVGIDDDDGGSFDIKWDAAVTSRLTVSTKLYTAPASATSAATK